MKTILLVCFCFQALTASDAVSGQIDQVCHSYCQGLAVQGGVVKFVDKAPHAPRTLVIGPYLRAIQHLVPRTEAPIRNLRSRRGWRIIVSAILDHDEGDTKLRVRFFDPAGVSRITDDVLSAVEQIEIGNVFGSGDEIFAISSEQEHAYNVQTEIWFLPEQGDPKRLLWSPGIFKGFVHGLAGKPPGVIVDRETYDGVHAKTKGRHREFYTWNSRIKSLTLSKA